MAVCRNFAKGGDEVGVFKKRGITGEQWKTMFKKIVFIILKGQDLHKGGTNKFLPPFLYTPLYMVSSNHTLKSK